MPNSLKGYAVIVGDANIDVTIKLTGLERDEGFAPHINGGGASSNTAVALQKLGIPTAFVGELGTDFAGRFMLKEFREAGIDTSLVKTDSTKNTISVFAFIDGKGERHLWAFPREEEAHAQLTLDAAEIDKIRHAAWVHSSGMSFTKPGPISDTVAAIFKAAYEAGVPTSFDLNTRAKCPEELSEDMRSAVEKTLPYVRYLLGSGKDEFYSMYPCADWRDSVKHFSGAERVVVARMGNEGSMTVCGGEVEEQPAFDVPVVNTTGAGDSFNAGFIAGMLEGLSVSEAVTWGNAVAGYKVTGDSSRHTPRRSQLEAFLQTAKRKGK